MKLIFLFEVEKKIQNALQETFSIFIFIDHAIKIELFGIFDRHSISSNSKTIMCSIAFLSFSHSQYFPLFPLIFVK